MDVNYTEDVIHINWEINKNLLFYNFEFLVGIASNGLQEFHQLSRLIKNNLIRMFNIVAYWSMLYIINPLPINNCVFCSI